MTTPLLRLIRPHFHPLKGYVSAGMEVQKDAEKIFLNANENPFALPGLEGYNRYPAPQPPALAAAYARAYATAPEHVIMTRGADEAIAILTRLFCEPGEDSVLICPPTFGMYGVNARAMPAHVREVPLLRAADSFALDVPGITAAIQSGGVKLVYLCAPNNPTGTSFPAQDLRAVMHAARGHAAVILDETYAEFSAAGSLAAHLPAEENLIILRTLSKSYGLAGMRMGCLLCADTDFTHLVRTKCLDAYPLPLASIEAALHALSPEIQAIAFDNIKTLLRERTRVMAAFAAHPATRRLYQTDANFFLVEMKDATALWEFAKARQIILRNFSAYPGTENCLRISIGTPTENDRLLEVLTDFNPPAP